MLCFAVVCCVIQEGLEASTVEALMSYLFKEARAPSCELLQSRIQRFKGERRHACFWFGVPMPAPDSVARMRCFQSLHTRTPKSAAFAPCICMLCYGPRRWSVAGGLSMEL